MIILGVETTCDESGIALIQIENENYNAEKPKDISLGFSAPKTAKAVFGILANKIATQYSIHSKYGGIVPILAAREHRKNLPIIYKDALKQAKIKPEQIDYIAFAFGPGLAPALIAGKEFVSELSKKLGKPIIPVNHLFGHLVIAEFKGLKIPKFNKIEFPALGLIVSGGHTTILKMDSIFEYKKIGETQDDAIGESLDKAGRALGLEYPGGPKIEKLAKEGRAVFTLPRPMSLQKNLNLSFAGLKVSFIKLIDEIKKFNRFDENIKADLAASFQKAAFDSLLIKVRRAVEIYKPKSLVVGGGVIANQTLQNLIIQMFSAKGGFANGEKGINAEKCQKYKNTFGIYFPDKQLATDNGVQIALAGYFLLQKGVELENFDSIDISANLQI
ncbi:MAG: tRNA (adenosine(37)-N6)-threonylcarbamoyltransferase complex transferase subunit TsaD [Patescibacteria group bacterium]|mgnify:FL=1